MRTGEKGLEDESRCNRELELALVAKVNEFVWLNRARGGGGWKFSETHESGNCPGFCTIVLANTLRVFGQPFSTSNLFNEFI